MKERDICLIVLFVLSVAAFISIVQSSKLKAIRLMKYAVKNLKKFKKLTPILHLSRRVQPVSGEE